MAKKRLLIVEFKGLLFEGSQESSQIFLRLCALTIRIIATHIVIVTESALITGADTWNRL